MAKRSRDSGPATSESSFKYANIQADEGNNIAGQKANKRQRQETGKFSIKREEESVPEKKATADFLGDDERMYLAAIKEDLARAVQNVTRDDAVPTEDDEDASSFGVIWDRIRGREVLIAKDKELSFILENLMRLTGAAGVSQMISLLISQSEETPTLLQDLACHSCASHIIEEIFERMAVLPDHGTVKLDRFLDFLLVSPSIFIDNPYAAHVAEKMLLRLCRIVSYKVEHSHILCHIADPQSGAVREVMYQKEDTTAFASAVGGVLDEMRRKTLRKVIGVFEGLIDSPVVGGLHGNVWTSAPGSVVLQALLVTLVAYRMSETSKSDTTNKKKSDDTLPSIPLLDKLVGKFRPLSMDKYGSRVAELLVALAPTSTYLELINTVCGSEFAMDEVIRDNSAHHILIKLVEFCTDIPLLLLLTKTLCEKVDVVLSSGHGMVLVGVAKKLADAEQKKAMCGRHGGAAEWNQCQTVFLAALKKAYSEHGPQGWTEEQKKDYFVIVVGALYPKNFRKDPKITTQNICMPGAQIVQSLCLFKENAVVNNSFLKLDLDLLTEYCSNVCGSYTIEKLLTTQKGQKTFYQPFIKSLIAISPDLAMTKIGSRTFDFVWKTVDLKNRELLAEALLPVEPKLRTNEFGRFLLKKLNLGLLKRSAEAWRNQQLVYEKEKSDLRSILEMSGKKKT